VRPGTLDTCRRARLSAGLAEVIKYGPIARHGFFDWIEANIDALVARDRRAGACGQRSCEIKAWSSARTSANGLARDPQLRPHLRPRDRVGLGYGAWLHGEAVGCGMVMAAHLSQRLAADRRALRRSGSRADRARRPAGAARRSVPSATSN
jgi:3-dehydroquinate synthase